MEEGFPGTGHPGEARGHPSVLPGHWLCLVWGLTHTPSAMPMDGHIQGRVGQRGLAVGRLLLFCSGIKVKMTEPELIN